ncbi:MAG: hypothetical protein MZV70_28755 [Desulfobacterales bacterium]|nr:hypothetical protein [Desulfobacterales bacterium]
MRHVIAAGAQRLDRRHAHERPRLAHGRGAAGHHRRAAPKRASTWSRSGEMLRAARRCRARRRQSTSADAICDR